MLALARLLRSPALIAGLLAPIVAHAEPAPLRIGILEDMASVYSESSGPGVVIAARLALEDFGPSVLGRKIELLTADHQNRAETASSIARRWYDTEGVQMIAGLSNSAIALAVQQVSREKERIDIVSGAATPDLTGPQCSPFGFHWTYDSYALARATALPLIEQGRRRWFFVTVDYALGKSLEATATEQVKDAGGVVLGSARHPLGTTDYSSYLLAAQSSGADVIGIANAGQDAINAIKQAAEFGVMRSGQTLAGLLLTVTNIHALGLETAQGLVFTEAFYWDMDDATRAFSRRFLALAGAEPTMQQAGIYSAVMHYLHAVRDAGTAEAGAVAARMRATPVEDFMTHGGIIRADGRVVRDLYLLKAKAPAESHGEWDLMTIVKTIPGKDAFRPMDQGGCPLVALRN